MQYYGYSDAGSRLRLGVQTTGTPVPYQAAPRQKINSVGSWIRNRLWSLI